MGNLPSGISVLSRTSGWGQGLSISYVRLYSKPHFFISSLRFILTANWLLRAILEELASRFVTRWAQEVCLFPFLAWNMFQGTLQTVALLQTCPVNRLVCCYSNPKTEESFLDKVSTYSVHNFTHFINVLRNSTLPSRSGTRRFSIQYCASWRRKETTTTIDARQSFLNTNDASRWFKRALRKYWGHSIVPCADEWVDVIWSQAIFRLTNIPQLVFEFSCIIPSPTCATPKQAFIQRRGCDVNIKIPVPRSPLTRSIMHQGSVGTLHTSSQSLITWVFVVFLPIPKPWLMQFWSLLLQASVCVNTCWLTW